MALTGEGFFRSRLATLVLCFDTLTGHEFHKLTRIVFLLAPRLRGVLGILMPRGLAPRNFTQDNQFKLVS